MKNLISIARKIKDKICIPIVLISVLISCFSVSTGCHPGFGHVNIDSGSKVRQPTFYISADPYFQGRLDIGTIIVRKAKRSAELKKGSELKIPQGTWKILWEQKVPSGAWQTVWKLEHKSSNFLPYYYMNCLFGWHPKPPVSSLTYGEVPPGYQEEMKAVPLEPEEVYSVSIDEYNSARYAGTLTFIIRLNEKGIPERLEYLPEEFISFNSDAYYLRLY